jgi:hypothetical protein
VKDKEGKAQEALGMEERTVSGILMLSLPCVLLTLPV